MNSLNVGGNMNNFDAKACLPHVLAAINRQSASQGMIFRVVASIPKENTEQNDPSTAVVLKLVATALFKNNSVFSVARMKAMRTH